ncbi:MAG TPA: histidine kinase [Anaerolineales bacterium]|nr:histidine kinase [Anaerolineales bacterium]
MSSVPLPDRSLAQRHWLFILRVVWVILCLVTIVMFISAIWGNYVHFGDPQQCTKGSPQEQAECLANDKVLHKVGLSIDVYGIYSAVGVVVEALPMILVGILIFSRKSRQPFGILFSLTVVVAGTVAFDTQIPHFFKQVWPNYPAFGAVGDFMGFLGGMLLAVWYCFPDGRFTPRWTRWSAMMWVGYQCFLFFFLHSPRYSLEEPVPWLWTAIDYLFALSAAYSLIYRYQHVSDGIQRQQIKWVVASGAFYVLIMILDPRPFVGSFGVLRNLVWLPFAYLSGPLIALSIAFSILRYRLWDIDIIINRALVYGALTASVIGIYVLMVGTLGVLMQSSVNWLVSILATGLIAVLAQPLRDRLQRGVNRMMYGERDDPVTVLSRLGQQLETALAPEAVLPSLVETIAQTLKLPYVAIELKQENRVETQPINAPSLTISTGHKQSEVICFPLVYQGEIVGQLLVAPRALDERFSPMDRHLLENIARQAGMAAHAVSITKELQEARQSLVTVIEEERRRLRRDLHDGLGPALASQGLKLAAAKQLFKSDPDTAQSLLDQVMTQNQETVGSVRRLVYGLRPAVLDERGLAEAIRDHVWQGSDEGQGLRLEVGELPDDLQSLPAAVEVAAYRIALEALTNIIRHAHAKYCSVRFTKNGDGWTKSLQIEIVDDGIGLPREQRAGIGLRSMRERAEELGGTLTVEPALPGGTRLVAMLPLGNNANSRDFDQIVADE